MDRYYRKAKFEDLDQIMEAVEDSREVLRLQGNGQWQDGYPNKDDFIDDINNGRLFVTFDKDPNEIVGVCALTYREEDYHHLYEGKWLTELPYIVMHRVAIKKKYKGRGYGKRLFELFIEQAKVEGYRSLRIDTHEGNAVMRHLIESFACPPMRAMTTTATCANSRNRATAPLPTGTVRPTVPGPIATRRLLIRSATWAYATAGCACRAITNGCTGSISPGRPMGRPVANRRCRPSTSPMPRCCIPGSAAATTCRWSAPICWTRWLSTTICCRSRAAHFS